VYRDYWLELYPDLRIDVFISLGVNSSFLHTGLSLPQAEAIVRRVIAVHNETVGPPYLVYAGITDKDLSPDSGMINSMVTRDPGIVIDSFSCAQPLPYPCDDSVHACATITGSLAPNLASKGRVTFQPVSDDCPPFGSHTWDLDPDLGPGAGCSASCSVESSPTTGDVTATDTEGTTMDDMTTAGPATATDTGPVADVDSCGCSAEEGHRPTGLLMLLIAATRRRRGRSIWD